MAIGAAVSAPTRPVSPARTTVPHRHYSPLNPLPRPKSSSQQPIKPSTLTHLSNLERLLQTHTSPPKHDPDPPKPHGSAATTNGGAAFGLLNALNLPSLFPSSRKTHEDMSPRSLTRLQRVLADSPKPSPRNSISTRWRQFHGSNDWNGLLDPLDENLRRELVRYGELVQAAYHAFHSNPATLPDRHRHVALPDRSYRVTRSLFATSSIDLPQWLDGLAPWMTQRSSWIGFVAVCDNDREIQRMGRRDIVISLRGTATCLEWAENFRAALVPMEDAGTNQAKETAYTPTPLTEDDNSNIEQAKKATHAPKVECGFWSLYKTSGPHMPSLSESVVAEVRRLMKQYKGEQLSITVTGHSLGAALALLVADELRTCAEHMPPVAVFSFGGPRVGNRGFADRVEGKGVKVLRVVNAHDVITRVPGVLPREELGRRLGGWNSHVLDKMDGYAHVGRELRVDSRVSPYLRPDADPACCHDLEAYLHLVDGFMGTNCPFRSNAKRSIVKLLNQQGSNVKKLYMSKARGFGMDPLDLAAPIRSNVTGSLASPSS